LTGFFRGVLAPFRGALFIARHGLFGYLVLPLLLNAGVAGLSMALGLYWVRNKLAPDLAGASSWLASIGLFLLAALAALLLFVVLQPIVGAPFIDLLSEKTETVLRGRAPSVGFWHSALSALLHGLMKAALYAFALAVVLVLGAISGIGGGLGVVLYAIFVAYDGFDYPLSRRGASFGEKWRYLAENPAQTIGFSAGAGVLYLVPLAAIVAPAFVAVGATLVYLEAGRD
jgi:CysZ protein